MISTRLLCRLTLLLLAVPFGRAYRRGDPVDMLVRTEADTTNALRSQVPQFATNAQVAFPQLRDQFSLIFSEGLWALPWTSVKDHRGQPLQKVVVSFVYSKSGAGNDGTIHSVRSENVYRQSGERHQQLEIEYRWIEEAPIDIQAGLAVMFLVTLVASVTFFIHSCGSATDDSRGRDPNGVDASGVPKWD